MDLAKRMKEIRKAKGITQQELAVKTNKAVATIIRYEQDYLNTIYKKDIEDLASSLGVSVPYFLGFTEIDDYQFKQLPVIKNEPKNMTPGIKGYHFSSSDLLGNQLIFVIPDHSYLPLWPKGTKCIIEKSKTYKNGSYVLAYGQSNKAFIIRKYFKDADTICLLPITDRQVVEHIIFDETEMEILGHVTEINYRL
ncbi:Helix-turn-helix domain-containing protein [Ignavigranum ruoffiae]|uniref:Helix-turn-helix domain-containing protein n=1 Tax=Ignavigranum ruoffiae TaxID=89093 RepID=A0A1H9H0D5_9LACT|nr:helix-turn-helix domain-containing protein [Ignavigranum ruoffiae]SEQ55713.1 Helix-turn-helix domain-containing protein [Ignavigranum ruoffiae]